MTSKGLRTVVCSLADVVATPGSCFCAKLEVHRASATPAARREATHEELRVEGISPRSIGFAAERDPNEVPKLCVGFIVGKA